MKEEPAPSTPSRQTPGSGSANTGEASRASEAGPTEGGGAPVVGAAAASTPDAYEAAVLAWIERHKQHPGGPAGVVTVRFTLDRRGALRASEVLTSSGMGSLDHAALSQLKVAAPFPRPAANTLWRTRDFVVRIDFRSLRAS
jgi:protein TonB